MFDDKKEKGERSFEAPRPPRAEASLVEIYKAWRFNNDSKHIPHNHLEAANWWIAHQEPRREHEQRQMEHDKKGVASWSDPYIQRVVVTWRTFLAGLSEPQKAFVIDGIENHNTPWRGDDIKFYKLVIEQQKIMDQDPEKYKTHALKSMAKALKKIGERSGALKGDTP